MKLYTQHTGSSITMSGDALFRESLAELLRANQVDYVIETGTFLGTGSTRTVAQAFPPDRAPRAYFTVEANLTFHLLARFNLRKWPFVKPLWGRTLKRETALASIQQDEALRQPERYPDVYIDNLTDPVRFYTDEVNGKLGGNPLIRAMSWIGETLGKPGEDLLPSLLAQYGHTRPLIILDSAGGIGWLEYQTVRNALAGKPYWLVLDDIHHLKHFRSLADVESRPDFRVIRQSYEHGWLLAEHRGIGD